MRVRPTPTRPRHPARALGLLAALAAAPLAGCSLFAPPTTLRGQLATPEQLRELIPGTSTRADATSLLGSPTARAAFDDNTWLYISQTTESRVARVPGVDKQDVLVLAFNQAGTLQSVKRLSKSDAKSVAMVARTTPSPGSEASFVQQLLGNVGRFTPGGLGNLGGNNGSSLGQTNQSP